MQHPGQRRAGRQLHPGGGQPQRMPAERHRPGQQGHHREADHGDGGVGQRDGQLLAQQPGPRHRRGQQVPQRRPARLAGHGVAAEQRHGHHQQEAGRGEEAERGEVEPARRWPRIDQPGVPLPGAPGRRSRTRRPGSTAAPAGQRTPRSCASGGAGGSASTRNGQRPVRAVPAGRRSPVLAVHSAALPDCGCCTRSGPGKHLPAGVLRAHPVHRYPGADQRGDHRRGGHAVRVHEHPVRAAARRPRSRPGRAARSPPAAPARCPRAAPRRRRRSRRPARPRPGGPGSSRPHGCRSARPRRAGGWTGSRSGRAAA